MSKANLNILIAVCMLIMALEGSAGAVTYYVDPNGSKDFTTIQEAIDDPCTVNGDEIQVSPGTYNEAINFYGKAVRLYSSGGSEVTVIDGTGAYQVVRCVSGEGSSTILESFTITGGHSTYHGGGMFCYYSSPTVTNCSFTNNACHQFGGGMYNYGGSPTVTNCTFSQNSSASNGAGMWNGNSGSTIFNCSFSENDSSGNGGGMFNEGGSLKVTNCTFINNHAAGSGGAMRNWASNPIVSNCAFTGNSASAGGGIVNTGHSNPKLTNCTFSGNSAGYGGGMYNGTGSPAVTNCTFSGNDANERGGGMYNNYSSPTVTNCTFSDNYSPDGGGMYNSSSSAAVTNCILWGDAPNEIVDNSSTTTLSYSDIQGGYTGTGNINADPRFVNPDNNDLHLLSDSPCIDAGDNAAVPAYITTDLDGNPRIANDIVDMGAYEYPITIVQIDIKPGSYPNALNINGNGVIPVAILGGADFDVTQVVIGSLSFAGLEVRVKPNGVSQCSISDVSGPDGIADGYDDLVCQFVDDPSLWLPGDGFADLTGMFLLDGNKVMPFKGSDEITIVP